MREARRTRFTVSVLGCWLVGCGPGTGTTASGGTTQGELGGEVSTGTVEPTTSGATGSSSGASGGQTTGDGTTGVVVTTGGETTSGTGSSGSDGGEVSSESGEASSGGSSGDLGMCEGWVPPGCFQSGICPEGQVCMIVDDICVSSSCSCDPPTGQVVCDPDCGGGSCVGLPACGCASDDECVKTTTGCCPCHMGGQEAASHVDCVEQVMQCDLPPDQVDCPAVDLCTPAMAACVNNVCVLK